MAEPREPVAGFLDDGWIPVPSTADDHGRLWWYPEKACH